MTIQASLMIANPIPATFLRGGTSKGIFLHRTHLPSSPSKWNPIFLGIMGSPDPQYSRQLNGMGGGISSSSKICVVSEPNPELKKRPELGVQVEYTFVQVGVEDEMIDFSGNCGNLSAVVGAFALDEGICTSGVQSNDDLVTIRSFNTNTQKIINTTFPVTTASDGRILSDLNRPEISIAGVSGKASKITMEFIDPSGARTGKLLPSGSPINSVAVTIDGTSQHNVNVSLVDAANPTVFVHTSQLLSILPTLGSCSDVSRAMDDQVKSVLESIRQQGAQLMGLDPNALAQPKIALVDVPSSPQDAADGVDVAVHPLSMGVWHKTIPITVALCLGVAAQVEGSLVWDVARRSREGRARTREDGNGMMRIKHPAGIVDVGAEMTDDGHVKSAKVLRTGRKLMQGVVWW